MLNNQLGQRIEFVSNYTKWLYDLLISPIPLLLYIYLKTLYLLNIVIKSCLNIYFHHVNRIDNHYKCGSYATFVT